MRQEPNYQNFLPGGDYQQWTAKKVNKQRGIQVEYEDGLDANETARDKDRAEKQAAKIPSSWKTSCLP